MTKRFTYEEVATILGVSRQTLYNWQKLGRLPVGDLDADTVEKLINLKEAEALAEVRQARERFRVFETERQVALG